jgi:hypothetical protein
MLLVDQLGTCVLLCVDLNCDMTFTQRIPTERLLGFDVQEGDTLQVVAVDSDFVVEVRRAEKPVATSGKASEWLRSARGSVKLASGETLDDVRMGYYCSKYGITA